MDEGGRKRDEKQGIRKIFLVVIALFFAFQLYGASLYADETEIRAGGYIKNFFILSDSDTNINPEAFSRLRLSLNMKTSDDSSFEFAYELLPRLRDQNEISAGAVLPVPALFAYRAIDFDEIIYPDDQEAGKDFVLLQNLDRALVTLSTRSLDISIGRQPIAFGSAHVINPTDIIAPFTYNTIAKEELAGTDAVRVKIPISEMGEFDIGVVFGDDFEPAESAGFIRVKTYQMQTDITFMTMVFRENILLGIDLVRSIGGANTWFEAAQTLAEGASRENYFRLSIGADYSFTDGLYTYIEYHYSGAGADSSEHYFDAINETAFREGSVYLLGRHYIAPGFTYEITPLLIFNAQALVNINDLSALGTTGLEYSVSDNIYLNVGAYAGLGEGSSDPARPENEFGLYPDVYYMALNFYF